jgi:hypothetical protein
MNTWRNRSDFGRSCNDPCQCWYYVDIAPSLVAETARKEYKEPLAKQSRGLISYKLDVRKVPHAPLLLDLAKQFNFYPI